MDAVIGDQLAAAEAEPVVKTYREIAERWGMGSTDAARMKAKRSGWPKQVGNHPGAEVRHLIPRTAWEAAEPAKPRSPGINGAAPQGSAPADPPIDPPDQSPLAALSAALDELREQLRRERDRAAKAEAKVEAVETAARERVERAEKAAAEARAELERRRVEAETIQRLGFLGRLAWALRGQGGTA